MSEDNSFIDDWEGQIKAWMSTRRDSSDSGFEQVAGIVLVW